MSDAAKKLKRIHTLYYLMKAMNMFIVSLTTPVWVLRMTQNGFDLGAVSVVTVTFSLTRLLADVPTGVLADRYGKRFSVLMSLVLGIAGSLLWSLPPTLPLLLAASVCNGLGMAFWSGAFTAWALDAIEAARAQLPEAKDGKEESTTKLFGWSAGVGQITSVLGGFVGGTILASRNLAWPFMCAAALQGLSLVLAYRFVSERREQSMNRSVLAEWREMGLKLRTGWRHATATASLALLFVGPIPMLIGVAAPGGQWPVRFAELAPNVNGIAGYVWAVMLAVSAAASFAIPWMVKRAGSHIRFLIIGVVCNGLAVIGVALTHNLVLALALFCLHVGVTTSSATVNFTAISNRIDPSTRATSLSLLSMSFSLSDSLGALVFGGLSAYVSMQVSWVAAGCLMFSSIPILFLAGRAGKRIPAEATVS